MILLARLRTFFSQETGFIYRRIERRDLRSLHICGKQKNSHHRGISPHFWEHLQLHLQ